MGISPAGNWHTAIVPDGPTRVDRQGAGSAPQPRKNTSTTSAGISHGRSRSPDAINHTFALTTPATPTSPEDGRPG